MNFVMNNDITLAGAQAEVDRWIRSVGNGYFSELTNMAVLTEEVGELARIISRRFGDQKPKPGENLDDNRLADELADVLWVVMAIANQTGVELADAFNRNLAKKTARDAARFA